MMKKLLLLTLSFILLFDLTVSQTLASGSGILIYPTCYDGKPAAQIILPAYFGSNIKTPFNYVRISRRAPGYTSAFPVQKVFVDNNASPVEVIDKGLEFSKHYTYNFIAVKENHWFDNPNLPVNTSETTIDTLSYNTAATCKNSNEAPAQPAAPGGGETESQPPVSDESRLGQDGQGGFDNNVKYLCNDKLLNNQQKQECTAYLSQRFNQCNDEGYRTEEQLSSCAYNLKLMFIRNNAAQNQPSIHKVINDEDYETLKGHYCDKGTFSDVNNPAECVKFTDNFCSQQNDVDKFIECIITQARKAGASSGAGRRGTGSSTGARNNTQAAPAGVTSSIPRITTPQANTTGRRIEILNAWCAAYLGANTAKGNDCVDKARDKCKQTDEEKFTNCVKGVGLEMQKDTATQSPPTKAPDNPGQPAESALSSDITITPTVNGDQKPDPLPQNTKTVNIGVKVFKTSDSSETPLNLNNIELILIRTTDEKTTLINPPTRITDLKTEAGAAANTGAVQNYTPYVATIPGWGKYELTAKVNNKTSQPVRFQVGGLGSGSGTSKLPKLFACTVNVDSKTADSIKVSAHEVANTNLVGYNRITWYLKEGGPDGIISDQYIVGTNVQFPQEKDTVFNNLKPNTRYTVLAAAYPDNLQANRVFCNSSSGINVITPAKVAQAQTNQQVLAATSDDSGPTSVSVAASCDGACQVVAQGTGEPFATQIYGTEVIDIPVANRASTDSVTVTVIPITDQEETVNAQTITIPLPGSSGEFTATTTPAPTTQNITLSKTPPESQLISPGLVGLIAQTAVPLKGGIAFINKNNPDQKYVVHDEDKDLKCAADPSQVCVYTVYLNKDEGSLENGNYSFQLTQDNNPVTDNTIDFEVLSENAGATPSAAGGDIAATPGAEIPTKITISMDGSAEQALFTRNQDNPDQVYYANTDFDLTIGKHDFIYKVYYNYSEENPNVQARIIERLNPEAGGAGGGAAEGNVTCGDEYAKDLGGGRAQNVKDCSDNTQPTNGEIYCIDPSQHIVDEHCESGGAGGGAGGGAATTTPEQSGQKVCTEGEYVRKCIQGTHCQYEVYLCNQNGLEYKGPEEDCQWCPDTRKECHNEDEELSPGCFQSYSVCPDGSRTPNGGPWSPDTGEACTPQ